MHPLSHTVADAERMSHVYANTANHDKGHTYTQTSQRQGCSGGVSKQHEVDMAPWRSQQLVSCPQTLRHLRPVPDSRQQARSRLHQNGQDPAHARMVRPRLCLALRTASHANAPNAAYLWPNR